MHFHPDWPRALRHTSSPALRTHATDDSRADAARGMGAARTALLRERVRSGYYASPAAMDQLAALIAASGDL